MTSPVLRFVESYLSISALRGQLPYSCCRPTFEFNPIIIILSCSSNMVAEGIGGQASGTIARRKRPLCKLSNNYAL